MWNAHLLWMNSRSQRVHFLDLHIDLYHAVMYPTTPHPTVSISFINLIMQLNKCDAQCLNVIIPFKSNTAKMDCVNSSLESSALLRKRRNTCSLQLFALFESSRVISASSILLSPSKDVRNSPTCCSWTWEGAVKLWHVYCRSCQCCYQQQMSHIHWRYYPPTRSNLDPEYRGGFSFKFRQQK